MDHLTLPGPQNYVTVVPRINFIYLEITTCKYIKHLHDLMSVLIKDPCWRVNYYHSAAKGDASPAQLTLTTSFLFKMSANQQKIPPNKKIVTET